MAFIKENKKKNKKNKKKKNEIEVAIPTFKRGSNDARTLFMIEKIMKEQPNLTKQEAQDLFFKSLQTDSPIQQPKIKKLKFGGDVIANNNKRPKGVGIALRGYGAMLKK
jgi:hypothetical protein